MAGAPARWGVWADKEDSVAVELEEQIRRYEALVERSIALRGYL